MKAKCRAGARRAAVLPILLTLLCAPLGPSASAATINVAEGQSIQAAINGANAEDQIIVAPGTYFESIDFIGKAVALRSSGGPLVTVIDGSGTNGPVVQCVNNEGADTILEGFTITGGNAENGGGMYNLRTSPTINDCMFTANTAADRGGGMHNYVGRAVATGNPTIINSLFVGNSASSGSAMRNNDPDPLIINSTFVNNTNGAAIRSRNGSQPELINSIVWGNPGGSLSWANSASEPIVSFSDIEGGHPGAGNLDADPLFASIAGPDGNPATFDDNDYRLGLGSPAIDAGTNATPISLPLTDLDGAPRIVGAMVDMGAYEFGGGDPCALAADCDDGNPCTTDSCESGVCSNPPKCNDGNACTTDSCDADGVCSYDPVFCGDGDACTVDSCDSAIGCFNQPLECPPGEPCSGGVCVAGCELAQKGETCLFDVDCCSNKCRGPLNNRSCKG